MLGFNSWASSCYRDLPSGYGELLDHFNIVIVESYKMFTFIPIYRLPNLIQHNAKARVVIRDSTTICITRNNWVMSRANQKLKE